MCWSGSGGVDLRLICSDCWGHRCKLAQVWISSFINTTNFFLYFPPWINRCQTARSRVTVCSLFSLSSRRIPNPDCVYSSSRLQVSVTPTERSTLEFSGQTSATEHLLYTFDYCLDTDSMMSHGRSTIFFLLYVDAPINVVPDPWSLLQLFWL